MKADLDIKVPIWHGRMFGIADFRLEGGGDIVVSCSYTKKDGELLYPYLYRISKRKALEYSKIKMGEFWGRAVPIKDFEVIDENAK